MSGNGLPSDSPGQAKQTQEPARAFRSAGQLRVELENRLHHVGRLMEAEIASSIERQMTAPGIKTIASTFDVVTNTVRNWHEQPDVFGASRLALLFLDDPDADAALRFANLLTDCAMMRAKYDRRTGGKAVRFPGRGLFDSDPA